MQRKLKIVSFNKYCEQDNTKREGDNKKEVHLPFAGIILFRFYGYDLSHVQQHPGNIEAFLLR